VDQVFKLTISQYGNVRFDPELLRQALYWTVEGFIESVAPYDVEIELEHY
jgi:hypothetical protein